MTNRNSLFRVLLFISALMVAAMACNLTDEDNVAGLQKRVTEERPAIVLLAPTTGNTYGAGTKITFHAMARDLGSGIARIEFRIDIPGDPVTLVQEATDPNGTPTLEAIVTWEAIGDQTFLMEAQAYRADGTPSNLEQTSFRVVGGIASSSDETTPEVDLAVPTTENSTSTQTDNAAPVQLDVPTGGLAGTIISGDNVPVRQGPTLAYPSVTTLNQGDAIEIVGRSEDSLWYAIRVGDGFGWVIQVSASVDGDISNLPVVEAPPQN